MALDVHIIEPGSRWPRNGFYTAFYFGDEHEEIFRLAHSGACGPQLAKMPDQYDDVVYEDDDLANLISELGQVIQSDQLTEALRSVLVQYQVICLQAVRQGKAILLFGD